MPIRWSDEERDTFCQAAQTWGEALQWLMVMEELAELGAKVAQMLRGRGNDGVAEEIADVLIMMGQAMEMFGRREVEIAYHDKLRRLQRRLDRVNEGKE